MTATLAPVSIKIVDSNDNLTYPWLSYFQSLSSQSTNTVLSGLTSVTSTNFYGNLTGSATALSSNHAYIGLSFNGITGLSSSTPLMNGVSSPGGSVLTSRADHIHPSDTSREGYLGNPPVTGYVLSSSTTGTRSWILASGTGTVTSVSVVSANGFAGSVASPSTVPAITLSTSAAGILKGVSGALTAAVSNTDYAPPASPIFTGTVLSNGSIDINVVGQGLKVAEGTNAKQGTATLVSGTVVVSNTSVTATSRIFISRQLINSSTALGELAVSARTVGTSFTVTAYTPGGITTLAGDLSTICYEIVEVG